MFLNLSNQQETFYQNFKSYFPLGRLTFIYGDSDQVVHNSYATYLNVLTRHRVLKTIGFISQSNDLILPYLSGKANILLNDSWSSLTKKGKERLTQYFDQSVIDREFLGKLGKDLTDSERFFVQFFRNLVSNKEYIIIDNMIDQKTSPEVRELLMAFRTIAQENAVGIILFTTNMTLIKANPKESLLNIPSLEVPRFAN